MIAIDKREFRSYLPMALYLRGFKIIPFFLNIGDYILSKNVVIERKQVQTSDLEESLKSGRLEKQIGNMIPKFRTIIILVELSNSRLSVNGMDNSNAVSA